jgi:glycine/D-amino acid oxidase-like deaminating enzyme
MGHGRAEFQSLLLRNAGWRRNELRFLFCLAPIYNPCTDLSKMNQGIHIAVVGAGAFGGWTALYLLRRGARVTLLDAWGPGNSRASSGGETRVMRCTYGPDRVAVKMAARALQLWKENETRWKVKLFRQTGVLWLAGSDDRFERAAMPILREAGHSFEGLTTEDVAKRYPQFNLEGIHWALLEKNAGYLLARRGCEAVLEGFRSEGGQYRQLAAEPGHVERGELKDLALSDGSKLAADQFVFACGPWLGKTFPDLLGKLITSTRQEVFYFGTPAGDSRFTEDGMPIWIDFGERRFYGIPGNQWRGFKLACDHRGPQFDPTSGERTLSAEGLQAARDYLDFRFPLMKGAPLIEARVCQYEQSPDEKFIIDRHPRASNVWIAGGGSGHGYKHGPAVGEMISDLILNGKPPDPFFALARFHKS